MLTPEPAETRHAKAQEHPQTREHARTQEHPQTREHPRTQEHAQTRAEGVTALEIARRNEAALRADLTALNIRPAEYSPRASESIPLMIEMIGRLIESGHAYPADDGSVFFDARSFPGYAELAEPRLRPPAAHRPATRRDGGTPTRGLDAVDTCPVAAGAGLARAVGHRIP